MYFISHVSRYTAIYPLNISSFLKQFRANRNAIKIFQFSDVMVMKNLYTQIDRHVPLSVALVICLTSIF